MAGYFRQVLLSFGKMKVSAVENMLHFKVYSSYLFTYVHKIQWVQFFSPLFDHCGNKNADCGERYLPSG